MIFPVDDILSDRPTPTPLYAATASVNEANVWTSINGYAAARIYDSVEREYEAAKSGAVIADFGPLSRYAIRGADAALFLARVVTAPASTLSIGESARGLMLDDDGGVLDLAEISRLTDDLFLLTTPSPQPRKVQLAARGLDVDVEGLIGAIGAIGVIGATANEALASAGLKSPGDHIAASAVLRGVETAARPMQFGALPGAELIFPADDALTVWERLIRRGKVRPIGLDAMEILRIESGAPRPGADFSIRRSPEKGRLTPREIGLPHLAPLDSGWFNGRRALRFAKAAPQKSLLPIAIDTDRPLPGAAVFLNGKSVGRVTSAVWSPTMRRVIAFALMPYLSEKKRDGLSVSDEAGVRAKAQVLDTAEGRLALAFQKKQSGATD